MTDNNEMVFTFDLRDLDVQKVENMANLMKNSLASVFPTNFDNEQALIKANVEVAFSSAVLAIALLRSIGGTDETIYKTMLTFVINILEGVTDIVRTS